MFSDQIFQFVIKISHHVLCYEFVVHVFLSLPSRRGNIDAGKDYPKPSSNKELLESIPPSQGSSAHIS